MSLTIDGQAAPAEGSLLDAVLALGLDLPHLCKDDNLPAIGACRTCLVEAEGRIVAACSLPAASVNEVSTTSDRARRVRAGVLQLTAAMQIDPFPNTPSGPCAHESADAYAAHGVTGGAPADARPVVDRSNTFFDFVEDACILCGRCVVACGQLQHIGAIGLSGRATGTRVTPGADVSFRESICTSCGSCIATCPTTALRPKGATQ